MIKSLKTILALIAVCLTIGYIWYGSRAVTPCVYPAEVKKVQSSVN
jgi:hypothetical protein